MLRDEILWRQKSREMWHKEGDKNSKFFHVTTIIRRRRNSIDAVKAKNGEWILDKSKISDYFLNNFKNVFHEEEVEFPWDLKNLIPPSLSEMDNDELCKLPTSQEIKETLFNMASQKAPGPDGLLVLFYKTYWHIVGINVVNAVRDFFLSGKMHKEVNNSLIVLIPKIQNPTSFNHFRPISLCNVVYKIIAKILVNRLRPLLPKLISPCQSAFVPGRWIAENEVVVQELLHSFKKRKVKGGFLAIKLDLQKAYDKVNWKFLQAVLLNFGFNERFVSWIKECISSISSAILVNGSMIASFTPSRGLR
jgi:hypothetical protein